MESSNLNDRLKDSVNKILAFVKKYIRYFAAGALFLIMVLVLVKCTGTQPKENEEIVAETQQAQDTEEVAEPYQIDAYENINNLITQYYAAYAAGDTETLISLAAPISENEKSYIALFSQYVEEYRNVKCYTKSGLDANSYLVSVAMEIKFAGVETTAPGLDFFYVRTKDDGGVYIDNLYSQYNLANQENALDTSIQSLIHKFENEKDVIALQQEVQGRYDAAVAADANLSNLITSTIPSAIADWVTTIVGQSTGTTPETPPAENTETPETPAENAETPETPPAETPETETPQEEQPTTETLTATDRVNVRAAADTSSDKLGTVEMGQQVTRTGTEGDWSIIDFNGTKGYIKSEYLTSGTVDEGVGGQADAGGISQGTEITLQDTVNVRSSMSETADRVGTAYSGEKVTVVMSYAEGWTKVNWNGKTGYIKTSLLQ